MSICHKTNLYIKTTLEFIKNNQVDKNGFLIESYFLTSIALLDNQSTTINTERKLATTYIYGIINEVGEDYVVILCKSNCTDKTTRYDEYTLLFDSIIFVSSVIVEQNFDEYKCIMSQLPDMKKISCDRNYSLLNALKCELKRYCDDSAKTFKIIYNGVTSTDYLSSDFDIIKDLIIIKKFYVLPISQVNGFYGGVNDGKSI